MVLLVLWMIQESLFWRYSWPRLISMLALLVTSPTLGAPMMISHLVAVSGDVAVKIPRKYTRFLHWYAILGLLALFAVLPLWKMLLEGYDHVNNSFPPFYGPATINWASAMTTRTLAVVYPPVTAWALSEVPWYMGPVLMIYGMVSLPALLAGVLILREVRQGKQAPRRNQEGAASRR